MGNHSKNTRSRANSAATGFGLDATLIRRRMVWRGSSMFLATLPLAAIAAFIGGPMAVMSAPHSTGAAIGSALLVILPLTLWSWVGLAVFCLVRRYRRNPAEAEFVAARKQADAAAAAACPPSQSSVSVGIGFFIGD